MIKYISIDIFIYLLNILYILPFASPFVNTFYELIITLLSCILNFMKIGDYLRKLRMKKGLSLRELQKEIGISYNTLGSYERNTAQPTLENIYKICRYFEVPIEYLFIGDESLKEFRDSELLSLFNKIDKLDKDDRDFIKSYLKKYLDAKERLDEVKKEMEQEGLNNEKKKRDKK